MGQEHSTSGTNSAPSTPGAPGAPRRSNSSFRAQLLGTRQLVSLSIGGGSKRASEREVPTVKKAKLPESEATKQTRDRLMSCPDLRHHTESEMVKRLEKLLAPKVSSSEKPVEPTSPRSSNTQALMKLFDGANPPKITVAQYLQRMVHYLGSIAENERKAGVDVGVHSDMAVRYILSAILYMERLQNRTGMVITQYNIHRLLITGIQIAAKVLDDYQPNQKYFADLGGVSMAELARLEAAFLQLCDYNVNVDPELFAERYASALERERCFSDVNEALSLGAEKLPAQPLMV